MATAAKPVVVTAPGDGPVAAAAEPVVGDDNVGFEKYQRSELAEGAVAV